MECESDAILFEITKLLNDPTITRKVLCAVLRHRYDFSNELIEQIVPKEFDTGSEPGKE